MLMGPKTMAPSALQRRGSTLGPGGAALRLAVLATALALTGCGGGIEPSAPVSSVPSTGQAPSPSAPAPSPSAASAAPAEPSASPSAAADGSYTAELAVTVIPEPGADPVQSRLQCDRSEPSAASNVPEPAAACELVQNSAEALFFTKPDPTIMCTEVFGGPQTATISGTVDGREVNGSYSLINGCEIDRWHTLEPLLGPGGAL